MKEEEPGRGKKPRLFCPIAYEDEYLRQTAERGKRPA